LIYFGSFIISKNLFWGGKKMDNSSEKEKDRRAILIYLICVLVVFISFFVFEIIWETRQIRQWQQEWILNDDNDEWIEIQETVVYDRVALEMVDSYKITWRRGDAIYTNIFDKNIVNFSYGETSRIHIDVNFDKWIMTTKVEDYVTGVKVQILEPK
jgi:hypothetical protein